MKSCIIYVDANRIRFFRYSPTTICRNGDLHSVGLRVYKGRI